MWKTTMSFSVIDLENNYFLIRFRSSSDAVDALTKGPWLIMGNYLTVQPWTPTFDFTTTTMDQVTIWIHLPGLAVHLYDKKILQKLGQLVGTVIKIDANTSSSTRGRFARIAVTISLAKPLVSQFELDGKVQKVEYEGLPVICFTCGRYGHSSNICKAADTTNDVEKAPQPAIQRQTIPAHQDGGCHDASTIEPFGPWMIVTRKGRKTNNGKENSSEPNRNREPFGANTTRFHILPQVPEEREDPAPAMFLDILSTSRQQALPTLNPTFTTHKENLIRTSTRSKLHNKAAGTKTQNRRPPTPMNPIQNPFPSSALNMREKEVNFSSHANPNSNPFVTSPRAPSNHQVSHLATTLDPTRHTVVFCSPQTSPPGIVRDEVTEYRTRQEPDPQHMADPPDVHTTPCVNEVENAQTQPVQPLSSVEAAGMSDDEDLMVQETLMASMDDINGEQY
ncbi:hypothetical protein WN944_003802 [Citrus x changshan-huyou]|uniref:CCHC-type domain-containing protein n=1 Tax=Citrus x changshan-huyou TaxID=2935761 RepID=A0AAP0LZA9_9ROSI